ncbi:MAG TPA: GNAT family N-acetyltransferase [Chitinophagaceae bacterium]|nr:GNAT family N-acetyltransferase [Chitinophagaceae bacterium]
MSFSDPHIRIADLSDIPHIVRLLNSSYRGDTSRKGWTTEADLIAGEVRTNEENLSGVMLEPGSVILKYEEDGKLLACVNLKKHGDRIYLGMFSVMPELQGGGIGKKMLQAAEEHAKHVGCSAIYMYVISVRTELIDWYKRKGYEETGELVPFNEDGLTGTHMQKLEFLVLEKKI